MENENEQSAARIKNVFLMLAIMAAMYLAGNWCATQKTAMDTGYNPVLGGIQIGSIHVYQPFAIRGWREDPDISVAIPQILRRNQRYVWGFLAVGVALCFLVAKHGGSEKTSHGTARFADKTDFDEIFPAKENGVVIGANPYTGAMLLDDGPQHDLLVAPTGSGKGVSLIIPTCTVWEHSLFVFDPKEENYKKTSRWRKIHHKQCVMKFEPLCVDGSGARWNPFAEINFQTKEELTDIKTVALTMAVPDGGAKGKGDPFWDNSAVKLIGGVILHLLYFYWRDKRGLPCPLSKVLQVGFMLYLMDKWIWLMTALADGFEMIGYLAAGLTGSEASKLGGDGIVQNAFTIFSVYWDQAEFSLSSLGLSAVNLIGMIAVLLCLILTAIEVTVAKIEFFTFALMTLPLIAFGVTEKFKFLFEKAIGAMVNLAIKVSVITFIAGMAVPFIAGFAKEMKGASGLWTNLGILLQTVLAAIMIYWITKSIPSLAAGLLNGQPSLGGAGMTAMATQAAAAPIRAAGMVKEASRMANKNGRGGAKGTLMELGKAAVNSRLPVQAFRSGRRQMKEWNDPQWKRDYMQNYEEAKLEEEQNRPKFDQKAAAAKAAAKFKADQRE